ncbi:MAG TPA: amidohydrolase family protein, partial [Candidatus Nitrosotenuis sp.]|nr:amidohydrolase family protein [Candidatus Nitrosotenuis sp.]
MLLKNISLFYGKNLDYITSADVHVSGQVFGKIKNNLPKNGDKSVDCEGLLLVPGFVNMHTHIGDSIAKDSTLGGTVDSKIHPVLGAKPRILRKSTPEHLSAFMKNTCFSMLKKGITTFVDFREGGLDGILLLKKSVAKIPIRSVILGRLEYYQDKNQIRRNEGLNDLSKLRLRKILNEADGLGVSGPNENSDSVLQYYSKTRKIRAIHSSETA